MFTCSVSVYSSLTLCFVPLFWLVPSVQLIRGIHSYQTRFALHCSLSVSRRRLLCICLPFVYFIKGRSFKRKHECVCVCDLNNCVCFCFVSISCVTWEYSSFMKYVSTDEWDCLVSRSREEWRSKENEREIIFGFYASEWVLGERMSESRSVYVLVMSNGTRSKVVALVSMLWKNWALEFCFLFSLSAVLHSRSPSP